MEKKYKFIDYMADALIEAWGSNLEEAFVNAARAFYDTMVYEENIECKRTIEVKASGKDLEELLYDWIETLIYLFDTEYWLTANYDLKIEKLGDEWILKGKVCGETYDKGKHGSKTHVKAVTYHEMKIEMKKDFVRVRYLLDL